MRATAFQIHALYLHYFGQDLPANFFYRTGLQSLWQLLGDRKLAQAIALVPNNSELSYREAGALLRLLDLWHSQPELFEQVEACEGECITVDRVIYRYRG
jgi:hypothetical protein